ncbi:MAG: hypothetical protein VB064_01390 [Oscillospiraceae bacterium]|nr:hypothetical protein [Oscillospiraceae bacterium]
MKPRAYKFCVSAASLILLALLLSGCSGNKEAYLKNGALTLDGIGVDLGDNDMQDGTQTLLADITDSVQADGLVSGVYRLELDVPCTETVFVKIDMGDIDANGGEDDGTLMLGVGVASPDGASVLYKYVESEITDKTASASFVPAEIFENALVRGASSPGSESAAETVRETLYLGLFRNTFTNAANGHFRVWFPSAVRTGGKFLINYNDRQVLLTDLETVYQKYLSMGFEYGKRTVWPMDVYIQSLDAEGYYTEGKAGTVGSLVYADTSDFGCIYLNIDYFNNGYDQSRVKAILAHEFFHFVQLNYSAPGTDCPWLDEATATYFEWKERGVIPDVTSKYWSLIFDGIYPEENTGENGYARMPLIDYLSQKDSEDFILTAYQDGGPSGDWDNALQVALQGPPEAWVNDFYNKYLSGGIISNYKPYTLYKELISGTQEEFTRVGTALKLTIPDKDEIDTALKDGDSPVLGTVSLSIPALGARLVALDIDAATLKNLPDDMDPVVHVEGNCAVTVYAIKGNNYEVLQGGGDAKLKDFKKAVGEKVQYLVLVVGLQEDGRADVEFSVQLQPGVQLDTISFTGNANVGGFVDAGICEALESAGSIPVDENGAFTATVPLAGTQVDDVSANSGNTVTYDVTATDFVFEGTWDALAQTGTGTVKCIVTSIGTDVADGTFGTVTMKNTYTDTVTGTFTMTIKDGKLLVVLRADFDRNSREVWSGVKSIDDEWVTEGYFTGMDMDFLYIER